MNSILLMIILIFLIIICLLLLRIYFIRKSLKNIENTLEDIINSDTNALITTSSSNKVIKDFVRCLNLQLAELRKQKLQYQNGNQELKRSITNISHDLRTPLTAIMGYLDLLKQEVKASKVTNFEKEHTPNQMQYLGIIDKKSKELIDLTDQLFDFSKTMDSNVELEKEECCLNEILEETLISYYALFKEKHIVPNIQLCTKKVYKLLNKSSCIRIFENILSNVLKYCDDYFKVELLENGTILFSNKTTSLDATSVQKIFDRYFTVENARKSTGLGLSIARQLVEANSGSIEANYENGNLEIIIHFIIT